MRVWLPGPGRMEIGVPTGHAERSFREDVGVVSAREAHLLGLALDTAVVRRVVTLAVDGRTVLTSTSVLPPAVADLKPWHEVGIGELAVPAGRSTPDGNVVLSTFEFAPADRAAFGLRLDDHVAMMVIRHRRQVRTGSTTAPAGVIVLARGDLVSTCLPIATEWTPRVRDGFTAPTSVGLRAGATRP